ncbi:MAG: hypothetical protein ABEJ26_07425 [Halosimplex sp.]
MSDDTVRCWLVDRISRDENLVTLVYATLDGERQLTKQLSFQLLSRNPTTAAVDVDPAKLEPTADPDEIERYATQAQSMADGHDPDDEV